MYILGIFWTSLRWAY